MPKLPNELTETVRAAQTQPFWWDSVESAATRPVLQADLDVDVAIVGAGFTGLWTAYYLTELDPALDIVVLEAKHVGYGASGRNGGWCYDGFAADLHRVEAATDIETTRRFGAALRETVDEVGRVTKSEGIEADYHPSGGVEFCRNGGQLARAHEHAETARRYGWSEGDARVLGKGEAAQIARVNGMVGALWASNMASLHPARLVHGLAAAVERRGVRIYEDTAAVSLGSRLVTTVGGEVSASAVLRCTEGYTSELRGSRRELAPFSSTMIATERIGADVWDDIGLADRQLFGDLRHLVVYGQRTAADRIAFGGRGAPYRLGSSVGADPDAQLEMQVGVYASLLDLLPQLSGVAVTHRWSGVLGVPRDWFPRVMWDGSLGWAGGYVGAGVAASNLAARTLAHLVVGHKTELVEFPWVNRPLRRWEPEPFRFLGLNAALAIMRSADAAEARTDRPARRANAMWKLVEF